MTPTTLPPDMAEQLGRRRAGVLRALRLLQYAAATPVVSEDQAVAHAVRLLRGPRKPEPPRVWVQRLDTPDAEWLELPGVVAVRWDK